MITCNGLLTNYDVDEQGRILETRGNNLIDVRRAVDARLKQELPEEYDHIEYFSIMEEGFWPVDAKWVAVFYVRGGSEGWYVHVETLKGERRVLQLLMKVWSREIAEKMALALSRILEV